MTSDTAKLKERLRIDDVIARLQNAASGIHLHDTESAEVAARDGAQALSVLVAAIERLEAQRDEAYMLLEDAVEYVEDPQFNNDICEFLNRKVKPE